MTMPMRLILFVYFAVFLYSALFGGIDRGFMIWFSGYGNLLIIVVLMNWDNYAGRSRKSGDHGDREDERGGL